uniref:Odorant receptor n=1 Tax=Phlebotomus papatasi TaxID=29031 RepID=A0A3F2ZEI3_PHLPP
MPTEHHWENYVLIKPKLLLGISIGTFCVTTEPLSHRLLIRSSFISTIICLLSGALHVKRTFEGQITGNLAISVIACIVCVQIISRTFLLRYHRNNLLELLDRVQSLYTSFENEKINLIAERNLTKFSNIWTICFKFGIVLISLASTTLTIFNSFKGEDGVMVEVPLIPTDIPYYVEIMLLIQIIYTGFAVTSIFYTDISIAFFGFELMAASDIIYDYISDNKNRIEEEPDFLKIVTIRYCSIMDNINRFNDIFSITNLVQFVTSAFLSFAIFFLIRLYPTNPVGYLLAMVTIVQLFLHCIFGEFIKLKMERLSGTLYSTNWYDLTLKNKRSFLIVLGMSQKEYGLRAAKIHGSETVYLQTIRIFSLLAKSWFTISHFIL